MTRDDKPVKAILFNTAGEIGRIETADLACLRIQLGRQLSNGYLLLEPGDTIRIIDLRNDEEL